METGRKIIVTGGAGYIGSHTVVELIRSGYEPIIVDDFSNSELIMIERLQQLTGKKIKFYAANCTVMDQLGDVFLKEKGIYGVIHFAAFKAVGESFSKAIDYYDNNINSTLNLLRLMIRFKVNHLVFSSSCTVYGQPEHLPVTEKESFKLALSPYGNTKKICEEMLVDVARANELLKVVSLRYFNPIGADPSGLIGELPRGIPNNLLPYITQVATEVREKLTVYGNDYDTPDGTCIRDYLHVVDLAKAHIKAIDYLSQTEERYDAFNIGVGKGISVLEIINLFEKVTGIKINYEVGPRREGDIPEMFADASKAQRLLGWKPEYNIEEAISHAWNFQHKVHLQEH
jgi:UDP-glucose 4-epimerase